MIIDKFTGRPIGDHGTHADAMTFALDVHDDPGETYEFLKAWQIGDLREWPEYYEWLNNRSGK